jgi:hypothetical protein
MFIGANDDLEISGPFGKKGISDIKTYLQHKQRVGNQ